MVYVARRRKTTKKRTYRRRNNRAGTIARIARQVLYRQAETKRHLQVSGVLGLSNVIMPDNISRWLISNCIDLSQGTNSDDAVGTMIQVSGLSVKMQFTYADSFAPYFKVFVVEASPSLLGGTNTIFENAISNAMLDNVQKQYKVLKCIVVNPPVRGHSSHETPSFFRKLWIPIKKKYDFRTSALTNSISKNIGIIGVAYVDGNPVNIDIGQISCYSTVYYKDF